MMHDHPLKPCLYNCGRLTQHRSSVCKICFERNKVQCAQCERYTVTPDGLCFQCQNPSPAKYNRFGSRVLTSPLSTLSPLAPNFVPRCKCCRHDIENYTDALSRPVMFCRECAPRARECVRCHMNYTTYDSGICQRCYRQRAYNCTQCGDSVGRPGLCAQCALNVNDIKGRPCTMMIDQGTDVVTMMEQ